MCPVLLRIASSFAITYILAHGPATKILVNGPTCVQNFRFKTQACKATSSPYHSSRAKWYATKQRDFCLFKTIKLSHFCCQPFIGHHDLELHYTWFTCTCQLSTDAHTWRIQRAINEHGACVIYVTFVGSWRINLKSICPRVYFASIVRRMIKPSVDALNF